MERGRASGDAAAHDRHVGALVAGERPKPERRSRAGAVGRVRRAGIVVQGKVHGLATVRHFQACRTGGVARLCRLYERRGTSTWNLYALMGEEA
jgi:hypothetical protein